jgi:hypothetical protein
MRYRVEKYAADGRGGAEDEYVIGETSNICEARAMVRSELGLQRLSARRRWSGSGGIDSDGEPILAVEAYHDSLTEIGCGGVVIVEA